MYVSDTDLLTHVNIKKEIKTFKINEHKKML